MPCYHHTEVLLAHDWMGVQTVVEAYIRVGYRLNDEVWFGQRCGDTWFFTSHLRVLARQVR